MAFTKTSIAVVPPVVVEGVSKPPQPQVSDAPLKTEREVGEERDGRFWDGEKWVTREEWLKTQD